MEMTDEEGRIVWWGTYKAFGSCWAKEGCSIENNLRLPGQYYDTESGLHYNCFRYYDPIVGRYISQDPVGYGAGDFNLYRYCGNDPISMIDPYGLFIGSGFFKLFHALFGKALGAPVEACYIAGKTGDSAIGVGLAMTGPAIQGPVMGAVGPTLEMVGGAQSFGLGTIVAGASTSWTLPIGLALAGGVQIGVGFNKLYEHYSGQPLGADIYDWTHPEKRCP
jgi:RHS repeat-associated protein